VSASPKKAPDQEMVDQLIALLDTYGVAAVLGAIQKGAAVCAERNDDDAYQRMAESLVEARASHADVQSEALTLVDAIRFYGLREGTLASLEYAFLGSPFFPVRIRDRIDVTGEVEGESGVVFASIIIVGNALIVSQVGEGEAAKERAQQVKAHLDAMKGGAS
jgi:hypothetical protein